MEEPASFTLETKGEMEDKQTWGEKKNFDFSN